jgi:hypothetical protein
MRARPTTRLCSLLRMRASRATWRSRGFCRSWFPPRRPCISRNLRQSTAASRKASAALGLQGRPPSALFLSCQTRLIRSCRFSLFQNRSIMLTTFRIRESHRFSRVKDRTALALHRSTTPKALSAGAVEEICKRLPEWNLHPPEDSSRRLVRYVKRRIVRSNSPNRE